MAIPKYTARRKLDVIPAGAKEPWPGRMSREAGAMARFGGTLMGVASEWHERVMQSKAEVELSTNRRRARETYNEFIFGLDTRPDIENWETDYNKTLSKIQILRPKIREAGEAFDRWFDLQKPNWDVETRSYARRRIMKDVDTDSMINLNSAIDSGDRAGAMLAIKNRVDSRLWTQLQGKEALRTLDSQIDYSLAFKEMNLVSKPTEAQTQDPSYLLMLSGMTGEDIIKTVFPAGDKEKYKNLTPEMELLLIRDADALAKRQADIAGKMLGMIQEKTDVTFFGLYFKGALMPHDVDAAVASGHLDRASGDRWLDRLANPRDFPTNPAVEADLFRRIEDPTEVVTKKDILNKMGDGLSVDDTRRFLTDIDVFKDPWFTRADRFLKDQLGWSDTYTKFMHPEGAITYHAAMNQLFTNIEEKKLRGKDIYERAIETGIPYIVDYWSNVLSLEKPQIERMKAMLRGKPVTPKPTEPAKKKKQQVDILDPEGIFK